MNNTCHFGPDKEGKFVTEIVSSELADKCDMSFCICDTHNFTRMNEERREKALENPDIVVEEIEEISFETVMKER